MAAPLHQGVSGRGADEADQHALHQRRVGPVQVVGDKARREPGDGEAGDEESNLHPIPEVDLSCVGLRRGVESKEPAMLGPCEKHPTIPKGVRRVTW